MLCRRRPEASERAPICHSLRPNFGSTGRSRGLALGYSRSLSYSELLETFLEFHRPFENSVYAKLESTTFDPHKKTAIYKFSNDLSHPTGKGFDPA